ncbi:GNAT family N-acetyltransferase [Pseudonocardia acidicola]|uniref:GNAT family N-acetyltransferase n=1 Tax=Pseudonocardia acidicola TaxID=2724939 RepID=A0ABX1SI56_9PSEU|nr:GNAT family N-acetyltransferase [Pseudonocardia acidicola]NMI00082.1 GNAT family N-acetyltransferase [Pseudonocardia acidicola]
MTGAVRTIADTGVWATRWVRDVAGFADLAQEWDALHNRCPGATAFQRAGWLTAWWAAYGRDDLRVLTVRRSGQLVAGAAVMLERRHGVRVLTPVGRGVSDVSEFLVQAGDLQAPALGRLSAALAAEPGWDVLDLPEVRAGGIAAQVEAAWPGRRWSSPSSVCLELPGRPLDELLPQLPTRTRGTIRRKLRTIDQAGVAVRTAAPAEIADGVTTLLALHERQWRGRGGNPEHLTPRFARLLRQAATALAATGNARLEQYRIDGTVLAAELLLIDGDSVGGYLTGVDPALRERVDTATLMVRHNLALTAELGKDRLSLLRGEEDYKLRWRPMRVEQHRVLLARRGGPVAVAYAGLVGARATTGRWLADRHPELRDTLADALQCARQEGPAAGARALRTRARTRR